MTGLHVQVEVLREALDESEPFRQRRPSFEPDVEPLRVKRPERMGHPIVLLNEAEREAPRGGDNAQEVLSSFCERERTT